MSELFQDLFPNKEWQQILSDTNLSGVKRKSSPKPGDMFWFLLLLLLLKEVYKLKMAFKYVSMPQEPAVKKRDAQRSVSVLRVEFPFSAPSPGWVTGSAVPLVSAVCMTNGWYCTWPQVRNLKLPRYWLFVFHFKILQLWRTMWRNLKSLFEKKKQKTNLQSAETENDNKD